MSEQLLTEIRDILAELLALSKSKRAATTAPPIDLDAPGADELIRAKMPKDWTGDDYKGRPMSVCPPELLEMIAARSDFFAKRNDDDNVKDDQGRPKSFYDKRTAARARAWAARLRTGWKPAATEAVSEDQISW